MASARPAATVSDRAPPAAVFLARVLELDAVEVHRPDRARRRWRAARCRGRSRRRSRRARWSAPACRSSGAGGVPEIAAVPGGAAGHEEADRDQAAAARRDRDRRCRCRRRPGRCRRRSARAGCRRRRRPFSATPTVCDQILPLTTSAQTSPSAAAPPSVTVAAVYGVRQVVAEGRAGDGDRCCRCAVAVERAVEVAVHLVGEAGGDVRRSSRRGSC